MNSTGPQEPKSCAFPLPNLATGSRRLSNSNARPGTASGLYVRRDRDGYVSREWLPVPPVFRERQSDVGPLARGTASGVGRPIQFARGLPFCRSAARCQRLGTGHPCAGYKQFLDERGLT